MSYRQAFHTSCRTGLSGHPGFQYNAASADLAEPLLADLAATHTGYRAAPDAPLEPAAEEIAALPVTLRYLPVEGAGPVVSRTAYVGREFRGAEGEPDSGRYGNYFSHIVVGDGDGFGGLLPIELWGAPHWSTTEVAGTALAGLAGLEPGPLDLDRVLARLAPRGDAAPAAVLDACLRAVLGGPRAVVVEADAALAADWIAWASFALPRDRVAALTFSTFDGRPRVADAVRVCVCTPACDVDFPSYELGSAVTLVDTATPASGGVCLYARVATALAGAGSEAVVATTRELGPGLDLAAAGARLAVAAERTDLADASEAPSVLAALRERLGGVPAPRLAAMAAALPPAAGSAAALAEWSRLHAAARLSTDPEGVDLVDESLRRLLGSLEEAGGSLSPVASSAPLSPSVGLLANWLELVSAAAGSERLGPTVAAGATLGLVGRNTALDRELASVIATALDVPEVRGAFEQIGRAGNDRVVECVALELAAAAGRGEGLSALRYVAADPVARAAVRANAVEDGGFEARAAWELLRVEEDPARRGGAVATLSALARTERQAAMIRELYGDGGPGSAVEHAEYLGAWIQAGRRAPGPDYRRALDFLAAQPLAADDERAQLFRALRKAPKEVQSEPEFVAWWLLAERAPARQEFLYWAGIAAKLDRYPGAPLTPSRRREVGALAARVAADSLAEADYAAGLEALLDGFGEDWPAEFGDALGDSIAASPRPEKRVATAFVELGRVGRHRERLFEVVLPRATRDRSPKQLEAVAERLGPGAAERWEEWLDEHPPRRAVSRAMRGVLRRGERE
ncbi:MAG TPA: hypothetical protein VGO13_07360 [Solirubrobacterales bacterium]|jgi:hypothetical protein|nr:hypothetical protein [Solirubrobacterales bacterium]